VNEKKIFNTKFKREKSDVDWDDNPQKPAKTGLS